MIDKIERSRSVTEKNLDHIEKMQEEMNFEEKLNSVEQRKLKLVYSKAVEDAKQEENLIRDALEKMKEIRSIRNERRMQVRVSVKTINKEEYRIRIIFVGKKCWK